MFATLCINSSNPREEVFDGQPEAGCRDARLHSIYARTHSDFALGICHQRLRSTNSGSSVVAVRTGTRRSSPRCSTGVSLIHHPHPVLVARRVADHAPDGIAVGLRLGESLDNTTMPQLSSRRIRERRRRRRSCTTPPAVASRLVHRHQGRRADGIHRHRRPFEIQRVTARRGAGLAAALPLRLVTGVSEGTPARHARRGRR